MRKTLILPAALLVAVAAVAGAQSGKPAAAPAQKPAAPEQKPAAQPAPPAPAQAGKPESLPDRASYIIGFNIGRTFKTNDLQVNPDLVMKGLRDGTAGETGLLTPAEMQSTMQALQQQVGAQQQAKQKALGEKNKAEGAAFLAKNKTRPGVKTTASGLQYEVLKEGTGPSPKATDTVTVNYKGTLMDGTVFDSSEAHGQSATIALDHVVQGWTEGVQLMKVGSKYKFYIPSSLGFGEQGPPQIGPDALLIFEVELLSIAKPEPAKPGAAPGQAQGQQQQPPVTDQKPPAR